MLSPHLDAMVAEFRTRNAPLISDTRTMLDGILTDSNLHARFANTLSMLEHIGSRKIMVTQQARDIGQTTLKHIAEEARHAFFFKRRAEEIAKRALRPAELVAPAAARMYFQRLETAIVRSGPRFVHARTNYLLTSMVIEFRAVWFYEIYQAALTAAGSSMSLKSLLAEERSHLTEMAAGVDAAENVAVERIRGFCAAEQRLYANLIGEINRTVLPDAEKLGVRRTGTG